MFSFFQIFRQGLTELGNLPTLAGNMRKIFQHICQLEMCPKRDNEFPRHLNGILFITESNTCIENASNCVYYRSDLEPKAMICLSNCFLTQQGKTIPYSTCHGLVCSRVGCHVFAYYTYIRGRRHLIRWLLVIPFHIKEIPQLNLLQNFCAADKNMLQRIYISYICHTTCRM